MKKFFAIVALLGLFTLSTQTVCAEPSKATEATEEVKTPIDSLEQARLDSIAAVEAEAAAAEAKAAAPKTEAPKEEANDSFHKTLKTKFIEGDASFMAIVAVAMILGLVFCVERIIYLSLAQINTKKFMASIAAALEENDVEGAMDICRSTAGPVAAICYQGLLRIDEGLDVVERSVVSYGSVQAAALEKNCSWITLFIAMAPSLGFLGTVVGMIMAFDKIEKEGDISPTVVAGGMKVALITTIYGIIVALVLQVFYNFVLTKIESITSDMEDSSITLLDLITKYKLSK